MSIQPHDAPVLSVDRLSFGYRDKPVLNEVSFDVFPGELVIVIGPNGCGKTTLVRTLLKTLSPDRGSIRLLGRDLADLPPKALSRHMAAVLQTIDPPPMTVRDYVLLGRLPFFAPFQFLEAKKDVAIAEKYMRRTGVSHMADTLLTRLSGGEKQLCAIARALTQEPRLLILDEPTAHLDITHQKQILDLITALKTELSLTVLMVLHDLNLAAEYGDRLVLLSRENGTVFAAGTPERVLTQDHVQTVYRTRVRVLPNPVTHTPMTLLINEKNCHAD